MNRRLLFPAIAPLLLLPSCSAFKLSETGTTSSRTSLGRASVAEGRSIYAPSVTVTKPQPTAVTQPAPAPVMPAPAPTLAVAKPEEPKVSESKPVKTADRQPAPVKRKAEDDAEKLRLPGDLLNQLPGEKDYKPSNPGSGDDAPVIAKPPGSR